MVLKADGEGIRACIKQNLLQKNGNETKRTRYKYHLHEVRDIFKSTATIAGVNKIASEWFLGHDIDNLGYDKSPWHDEGFFRTEYLKMEPLLNIISNPEGRRQDAERRKEEQIAMLQSRIQQYESRFEKLERFMDQAAHGKLGLRPA